MKSIMVLLALVVLTAQPAVAEQKSDEAISDLVALVQEDCAELGKEPKMREQYFTKTVYSRFESVDKIRAKYEKLSEGSIGLLDEIESALNKMPRYFPVKDSKGEEEDSKKDALTPEETEPTDSAFAVR